MHLVHFLLPLLVAFQSYTALAQFSDNFNDGNLNLDPTWHGDTSHFNVVSGNLRLSAPALTDTTYIFTASEVGLEAHWSLKISLDFNPSSSNYCLIYLMSDSKNLTGSLNGYFVKIGGTGDDISLYRQDGASIVKIIDGRDKTLNKSKNELVVEVSKGINHNWFLTSDTGSSTLISEGFAIDSTYLKSNYFGISCRHTSTRSDKFGFDDVLVSGKIYTDLRPPVILTHSLSNERTWEISFDEKISRTSIKTERFHPDFENGVISSIDLGPGQQTLSITFESPFPHGQPLKLGLDSISDTLGNAMKLNILSALFNDPDKLKYKDILINEIMFDPTPPRQLPPKEYLELYNNCESYLDLSSWKLTDEKDSLSMPSIIMAPNEVILLISQDDSTDFKSMPSILLMPKMISLSNNGEPLRLLGPTNKVIDSVLFLPSWIKDEDKRDGGWSLELINPEFLCSSGSNWSESADQRGGSPGIVNSVYSSLKTESGFALGNFLTLNDSLINVTFNGSFLSVNTPQEYFSFEPYLSVSGYHFEDQNISFYLSEKPQNKTTYNLTVQGISDCYLSEVKDQSRLFRFPEPPLSNDLIINEILFNPYPNGSDFVEIYNNSNKYIDLSQCLFSNNPEGETTNPYLISSHFLGIKPKEYLAICDDSSIVKTTYSSPYGRFHQASLPTFSDRAGHAVLLDTDDNQLDRIQYSEDMHFSLIEDAEGISLERISFDSPGIDLSNWHSAGSMVGYASPGYRNSQGSSGRNSTSVFYAQPDIFSPDNDGYHDILQIDYALQAEGFVGSLWIMNKEGQIVRKLASNVLLGREGCFFWDGSNEQRKKAPVGYYIAYLEVFDAHGKVSNFKTTFVLANHL